MIAAGFPADILRVTGQPAFDDWVQTPALPASAVAAEPVVLFLSQPLLDLYGPDLQAPGHPGFTEREVVEALARALSHLARARRQLIHLVIRPHPARIQVRSGTWAGEGLRVRVEKDGTLVEALAAADLAVGMTTMALLEASVRGRVVLSVQPRGRDGDPVPRFAAPGLVRCYDVAELPAVLASLLFDEDRRAEVRARAGAARPQPGAARRVADWMISSMRPAGAGGG
jgi:hypothetical protein